MQAVSLEQLRDHAEALVEEPELPIGKRLELQELLDALDLQEQQVVCADAAVSAVAKVGLVPCIQPLDSCCGVWVWSCPASRTV